MAWGRPHGQLCLRARHKGVGQLQQPASNVAHTSGAGASHRAASSPGTWSKSQSRMASTMAHMASACGRHGLQALDMRERSGGRWQRSGERPAATDACRGKGRREEEVQGSWQAPPTCVLEQPSHGGGGAAGAVPAGQAQVRAAQHRAQRPARQRRVCSEARGSVQARLRGGPPPRRATAGRPCESRPAVVVARRGPAPSVRSGLRSLTSSPLEVEGEVCEDEGPGGAVQQHHLLHPRIGCRAGAAGREASGHRRMGTAEQARAHPRVPAPRHSCQLPAWPCSSRSQARRGMARHGSRSRLGPRRRAAAAAAAARPPWMVVHTCTSWPRGLRPSCASSASKSCGVPTTTSHRDAGKRCAALGGPASTAPGQASRMWAPTGSAWRWGPAPAGPRPGGAAEPALVAWEGSWRPAGGPYRRAG